MRWPRFLRSVYVDANDISHRPAAATIARNDQTQCLLWQWGAVFAVSNLNRLACKLRCDFGEGDDGHVSVRAGDANGEVNLLSRFRGIDRAGINKDVPKERATPLVLLLAVTRHETHALSKVGQPCNSLRRERASGRAGNLYE